MSEASMHDLKKTRLFWLNRQKVDLSYIICTFSEFIRCLRMFFSNPRTERIGEIGGKLTSIQK